MGLLKSLFDIALKVASDSMKAEPQSTSARQTPQQSSPDSGWDVPQRSESEWEDYFSRILGEHFPEFAVKKDVPVTDLAGDVSDSFQLYPTRPHQAYNAEWGKPYTFVLSKGGVPVAVVMLGSGNSHSRKVKFLISRMYAKKLSLPYINFYTDKPNEEGYVVERIRKFIS